jgi:hypothetical protein
MRLCFYATLTSWGMHRMDPVGPKLVAFDDFAASMRDQVERLSRLEALRLEKLSDLEATEVSGELWEAVQAVSVSASESRVVAGTKARIAFCQSATDGSPLHGRVLSWCGADFQ